MYRERMPPANRAHDVAQDIDMPRQQIVPVPFEQIDG
jgi:hypothetical protein